MTFGQNGYARPEDAISENVEYECEECGEVFDEEYLAVRHVIANHDNNRQEIVKALRRSEAKEFRPAP